MVVDDVAMQESRASAAMVLTSLPGVPFTDMV